MSGTKYVFVFTAFDYSLFYCGMYMTTDYKPGRCFFYWAIRILLYWCYS